MDRAGTRPWSVLFWRTGETANPTPFFRFVVEHSKEVKEMVVHNNYTVPTHYTAVRGAIMRLVADMVKYEPEDRPTAREVKERVGKIMKEGGFEG